MNTRKSVTLQFGASTTIFWYMDGGTTIADALADEQTVLSLGLPDVQSLRVVDTSGAVLTTSQTLVADYRYRLEPKGNDKGDDQA